MRSCQDSVAILTSNIATALAKDRYFGALFIDTEGAFDFVVPNILIKDLIEIGIPAGIIICQIPCLTQTRRDIC